MHVNKVVAFQEPDAFKQLNPLQPLIRALRWSLKTHCTVADSHPLAKHTHTRTYTHKYEYTQARAHSLILLVLISMQVHRSLEEKTHLIIKSLKASSQRRGVVVQKDSHSGKVKINDVHAVSAGTRPETCSGRRGAERGAAGLQERSQERHEGERVFLSFRAICCGYHSMLCSCCKG